MSLNDEVRNPLRLAQMGAQWLFRQRGPLTVGAGQVGGLVAQRARARRPRRRALQRHAALGRQAGRSAASLLGLLGVGGAVPAASRAARSRSRSADPLAPPRIRAGYLTEPHDAKVLVAGLRMLREIYAQPAFRDLVTGEEYLPGNGVATPAALEAFARAQGRHRVPPGRHLPDGRRRRARWSTRGCACAASTACA